MKSNSKQNVLNIASNLISLIIQFAINFVIVPKIIKDLGTEAVGYVNVSIDVVGYFSIISIIFNSVAGRYITIEINQGNYKKASEYFNSVILANLIISIVIALSGIALIPNIDKAINVTPKYLTEVKITFLLTWITSIVNLMASVLTIGTYAKNKLNVNAVRTIISNVLKLVLLIVLFSFFTIKVYFQPIATLGAALFLAFSNLNLTRRYLPDLKFNLKLATKESTKTIAKSGIWLSLTSVSTMLMRGLDNILANKLFDQIAMGDISTARTIPNAITTVINTLSTMFTPTFVMRYSENDNEGLIKEAKKSIVTNGLIVLVPVAGFIAFSKQFYALWLDGSKDANINLIIAMSTITVVQAFFNSATASLSSIFIVVDKLKATVICDLLTGIGNIILVLILAKATTLGVIILTITNTAMMMVRYVLFRPWYSARVVGANAKDFYLTIFRTLIPAPILLAIFFGISNIVNIDSWFDLILVCGACGIFGYLLAFLISVPKNYKKLVIETIKSKIQK